MIFQKTSLNQLGLFQTFLGNSFIERAESSLTSKNSNFKERYFEKLPGGHSQKTFEARVGGTEVAEIRTNSDIGRGGILSNPDV